MNKVNALTFSEIAGIPQDSSWSQVFFTNTSYDVKEKGQLFYLISIINNSDEDTTSVGKLIATRFEEDYYSSSEKILPSLKNSITKIKEIIKARQIPSFEIAAGVIFEKVLYIVKTGKAKVFLGRDKKLINLLGDDEETTVSSGFLRAGDIIIVSSSGFIKLVGLETIHNALGLNNPEEITSELAPIVLGASQNANCCFLVIAWKEEHEGVEIEQQKTTTVPDKISPEASPFIAKAHFSLIKTSFLFHIFDKQKHKIVQMVSKIWPSGKTQKTAISVAIIIVILLLTSVALGITRKEDMKRKQEFEIVYLEAKNKFEEGKAIIGLNNTQARSFLNSAKDLMSIEIGKIKNKKSEDYIWASDLLLQINTNIAQVSGIYKITSPDTFYDLTLIKDGAEGIGFSLYKKSLAVLDNKNKTVYLLSVNNKSAEVLAGGDDLLNMKFIAQGIKTYLYSQSGGIFEVDAKSKKLKRLKTSLEKEEATSFASFAGNLYILTQNNIIKYSSTEDGFSEGRSYLAKDLSFNLPKSLQMVIDGYVWVLQEDGNIVKFSQGRPTGLMLNGFDQKLNNPLKIFVSDETKNAYILDKGNKRVVVMTKEGNYQSQYQWDGIANVTDMTASEELKKIFLLSANKIFALDIK
jgi:hypothetical protein